MNKTIRFSSLFLVMAVILVIASAGTAAAAPANTFPGGAAYIDNQTHSVDANTSLWYKFDYAGDRSGITVTLVNGNNSGIHFNVFTPAEIGDWWETPPIGRGTALTLDCTTGLPTPNGACQSNDLSWGGNFNASGTYYVQVINTNTSGSLNFQLTIQGDGVTLGSQPSTPPSQPQPPVQQPATQSNPSTATTGTPTNTFPGGALVMDNQPHTVPANGSLWYRFNYVSNHTDVTITLVNGTNSGLGFNVFTPGQIGDWWAEAPIGRGTAQTLNCANGAPTLGGGCQSSDLLWVGNFTSNMTIYVQVVNNTSSMLTAQLLVQGDGVSLSQ